MDISSIKIAAVSVISIFCIGCGSNIRQPSNTGTDEIYGTYMFSSPCHSDIKYTKPAEFVAGAAAILAAEAAKIGVDMLGKAIKKAATDKVETTTVVSNQIKISDISTTDNAQCLHIVRAKFEHSTNPSPTTDFFEVGAGAGGTYTPTVLTISGTPELHAEILPVVKGNAIAFVPLSIKYYGFTPSEYEEQEPRDISIFIGYVKPDKDATEGDFPGRALDLGVLDAKNKELAKVSFVHEGSVLSANQTQFLKLDFDEEQLNSPMSFAATVIETKKAGEMAKFWASVFEASDEQLKTAAATAVTELEVFKSKQEIEQAKWDNEEAKNTAKNEYYNAAQLVIAKQEELQELCAGTPKKSEIFKTKSELFNLVNSANLLKKKAKVGDADFKPEPPSESC